MEILFNKLIGNKKLRYFIGILVFITVIIVSLIYLKKARHSNLYQFYTTKVRDLPPDVTIGSPINLFGLKVGRVEEIRISKDFDGVEMRISILKEVDRNLKTDACLTIVPKLFGSPELNLDTGKESESLGEKSAICIGTEQSIDHLIRKNLKSIYDDIIPAVSSGVKNYSTLAEQIKSINFEKIGLITKHLEEIMQQTNKFVSSMDNLQIDLKSMLVKMNATIDNTESFTRRVNKFAEGTLGSEKNLADAINKIFTNTETLIQNANVISNKTQILLGTFEKSGQSLNAISSDVIQITNSLPALINGINKLVEDYSIIGSALQRHWLLKGSVENVKKGVEKQKTTQEKDK